MFFRVGATPSHLYSSAVQIPLCELELSCLHQAHTLIVGGDGHALNVLCDRGSNPVLCECAEWTGVQTTKQDNLR